MKLNPIHSQSVFFENANHSLSQDIDRLKPEKSIEKNRPEVRSEIHPISIKLDLSIQAGDFQKNDRKINLVRDQFFEKIDGSFLMKDEPHSVQNSINLSSDFHSDLSSQSSLNDESEYLHRRTLALEYLIRQQIRNPDDFNQIIQQILETAAYAVEAVQNIKLWLNPETNPGLEEHINLNDQIFVSNCCVLESCNSLNRLNILIEYAEDQIGILQVERENLVTEWTKEEQSFLESLTHIISITLERSRSKYLEKQLSTENDKLKVTLNQKIAQLHRTRQELQSQTTQAQNLELSLQEAEKRTQTALSAKRTFLRNITHELYTPIHAIIGYSDLLCEEMLEQGQVNWLPDVQIIRKQGYQLLHIIDSILDLVRIETRQISLNLDIFDPVHVIQGVVEHLVPLAEKNHNQLKIQYGCNLGLMHSDLGKLQKILYHLLKNALTSTTEGQIKLTIHRHGNWIDFNLTDTEIKNLTRQQDVFKTLTKAENLLYSTSGGTELGLTICHHLCEIIGGEIRVLNSLDQDSTITVRLQAQLVQKI